MILLKLLRFGIGFLKDETSKTWSTKKIDNLDFIKISNILWERCA